MCLLLELLWELDDLLRQRGLLCCVMTDDVVKRHAEIISEQGASKIVKKYLNRWRSYVNN